MARPRSFNEEDVLDQLIRQFWEKGFDGVSIRDLEAETGLRMPSLYGAFGDKRSLFRTALEHYVDSYVFDRIRRFSNTPATERVRGFMTEVIERSITDQDHKGCLLINTAVDVAPHDADVRVYVNQCFEELERFFRNAIEEAVGDGNPLCPEPAKTARSFLGMLFGLRVMARARLNRATMEDAAETLLGMIDRAARARR